MSHRLAHLLSGLFHPLLVPTYLVYLLLYHAPGHLLTVAPAERQTVLAVVALSTFVLPALGTYALVRAGRASSIRLPNRRERHGPLLLALVGFSLAAWLLWAAEPLLGLALALQAVAVGLTWLVTRYWLISAHSVAMGGVIGMLVLLERLAPGTSYWPLAAAVVLAGAVGSARLKLNAHSAAQVWAGLGLGLGVGLGASVLL